MTNFTNTTKKLHKLADVCPFDFRGLIASLPNDDDGFLGHGADLSINTLLHAYRCGAFPWFNEGDPIYWWSPPTRCVIDPKTFKPSKSLVRVVKKQTWTLSVNHDFNNVMDACSQPRNHSNQTWITKSMKDAYQDLHKLGIAVSIEIWENIPNQSALIGGLYGVNLGGLFCGESMFHKKTDASKVAFWGLMRICQNYGIQLIDCQLENPHLIHLGATLISRREFLTQSKPLTVKENCGIYNTKISLPVTNLITSV